MIWERFSLKGKTALVTGSSRGLGAGIAIALAEAGANVAIHGSRTAPKHTQQMLGKIGANHFAVVGDVSDASVCSLLIEKVVRHFGTIDILVNNAGIQRRGPFESFPEETWREIMGVNLDGVFHVTQAVGALMLERSRGRIINICSVASELARATIVPYAATKGALRQMTRGLCAEWAKRNIQINAIAPGYIGTELNRALLDDAAFSQWVCARTPAGRWGDVDELAGAVIFLSSDAASYVNGHVLYVDGGLSTSV